MNAFAALLILAPLQGSTAFGSDFILTEKQAFMVLPPQAVGGPQTTFMSWSPSGRYLLMKQVRPQMTPAALSNILQGQRPPEPMAVLSVWDKNTQRTIDIGQLKEGAGLSWISWFPGTNIAMTFLKELVPSGPNNPRAFHRTNLLRIDAARAQLTLVPIVEREAAESTVLLYEAPLLSRFLLIEQAFFIDVNVSPAKPRMDRWAFFLDSNGQSTPRVQLPFQHGIRQSWVGVGDKVRLTSSVTGAVPGPDEELLLDARTGKVLPPDPSLKRFVTAANPTALTAHVQTTKSMVGTASTTHYSAWLMSTTATERDKYMLAARAEDVTLNSSIDAVAVLDQGVVTIRLLAPVPMEVYLQAKTAAEKTKALSEVKQIGIAAHMFGADNDDRFPSPEEFQSRVLHPYMKNDATFEGFVYTFAGGPYGNIKNPSETVLGYKPIAGGYAVVFADSHAKWLKELPKNP